MVIHNVGMLSLLKHERETFSPTLGGFAAGDGCKAAFRELLEPVMSALTPPATHLCHCTAFQNVKNHRPRNV